VGVVHQKGEKSGCTEVKARKKYRDPYQTKDAGGTRARVVAQMDIRFWLVPPYRVQGSQNAGTRGRFPPKKAFLGNAEEKQHRDCRASALGNGRLPARANIAISEEREEIIPMRECEQTSAVNMETARKSKKTKRRQFPWDKSRRRSLHRAQPHCAVCRPGARQEQL